MELTFTDYFANGLSPNKLSNESPVKFRIYEDKIIFTESHPEIINICAAHVPNETPWVMQITTTGTAANIIKFLSGVSIYSLEDFGAVKYLWCSVVEDANAVHTLLNSYIEPEKSETIIFEKFPSKNILSTNTGDSLTSIQPNEIIVSKNSGQFTSILAAINYLNTLQDKAVIIRVFPGIYFESATIDLPDYACLIGEGSAGNTIIIGVHSGPLINTHSFNFVKNLNLVGGSCGINHNGSNAASFSLVKDCMIKIAGTVGINVTGGVGSLSVSHISIYADPQSGFAGRGVSVDGSSFIASELIIQAQVEEGIYFKNGLGTLDLVSIYYAQKGICCEELTAIKGTLVNLVDCYMGLHIMPGTSKPHICLNYLHIDRSTIDIQSDGDANLEIYSGHIDPDKVVKNVPVNLTGNFYTDDEGVLQNIVGDNHVHGSLCFLPNETFATKHLSFFENYILLPANTFGFKSFSPITEIYAWSGSAWTQIKFVTHKSIYWLGLDFTNTSTTINSIEGLWIKITGDPLKEIEFFIDSTLISGPETFYLNSARKLKNIYLTSGTFITPIGADTATPYKIIIKANTGITVNSTFYPQNYVEVNAAWTSNNLQTFTYSATGLSMLAVSYYELYY